MTKSNKKRGKASQFPAIISIAMVLLMTGLLLSLLLHTQKISNYLKENITVKVFFVRDLGADTVLAAKKEIESYPEVKEVNLVDKTQAAKDFEQELGQDFISIIGYNPLPDALEISVKSEFADNAKITALKQKCANLTGVLEVKYAVNLVDQINENAKIIGLVMLSLCIIFIIISIILINNTVKLALYANRFIIRSMQLVGATNWFIIKPFLWRGIVNGFIGGLIAIGLISGILYLAYSNIKGLFEQVTIIELSVIAGIILLSGILFTLLSTWRASVKYLKMKIEDLY